MAGKLYLRTFGCQMNEVDSASIARLLEQTEGLARAARPEDADLIVFNTCSVREKAQEKVFADLGRVKHLKRANPDLMIAVGGCVASQEGAGIVERAPFVDVVFGPQTLHRLPALLAQRRASGRAQLADLVLVLERGVAALHEGEYAIGTALHRQMQMARELAHVGIRLDEAVRQLERMRRREADAFDARHRSHVMDERREIDDGAIRHRAGVGVHVLPEQRHFAHALRRELANLLHGGVERAAHFVAACVGDDAEAAVLAAAFHDRNEGGAAFNARRRQAVEFFDFGE